MIRISIPYLITIAAAILLLIIGNKALSGNMAKIDYEPNEVVRAEVLNAGERIKQNFDFIEDFDDYESFSQIMPGDKILFDARITSGPRKGETVTAEQTFSAQLIDRSKDVEKGDKVLLINNNIGWYFNGYARINHLIILGLIFALCLLLFGGKKGFNTILSLSFTCIAIFTVFIPAILSGHNIYLMALLVCAYVSAMVPLIVMGYNKKSLSAILGCIAGVIAAGLITLIMNKVMLLTGIADEYSRYLIRLPGDIQLDLKAIIFAGIIIGAMGAIMDVSISISSALWEIKEKVVTIKFKELFRSGINIGRDIMGTMADTLILAYIGSSLTLVLLLSVTSRSLLELFNSEMIAVEILQALAGSLGILFAMPLTALFCSVIYVKVLKK